ncbi:MAG: protein-L-isoaspartate O-methyltransferase [Candidatus Protistobacter heckmanni]|nr:protein-L-isoaspartate O-methyltransferase [Candidatus Protistobacter heckmanni]
MDVEKARFNMIEQQIRPWDVLDLEVLDLLTVVKREAFVPAAYRSLAFVDMEIPLLAGAAENQHMLAPKVEARLMQELAVRNHESVLEIGAGSGYMAALLACRARHVTTVEIDPRLADTARANLTAQGVLNADVVLGDGARGWSGAQGYDVICISGSLPVLPEAYLKLLNPGGRLAAFVGGVPVMEAKLITRTGSGAGDFTSVNLFETSVAPLTNTATPSKFRF